MKAEGDTVEIRCPVDRTDYSGPVLPEPATWLRGTITKTLEAHPSGCHAVHVVRVDAFKWQQKDPWGIYDGVPDVMAREMRGGDELEFIDTWPRTVDRGRIYERMARSGRRRRR